MTRYYSASVGDYYSSLLFALQYLSCLLAGSQIERRGYIQESLNGYAWWAFEVAISGWTGSIALEPCWCRRSKHARVRIRRGFFVQFRKLIAVPYLHFGGFCNCELRPFMLHMPGMLNPTSSFLSPWVCVGLFTEGSYYSQDTLFDPVALGCGHLFCNNCACSAANVLGHEGLQAASCNAQCAICRQVTYIHMLLSARITLRSN